MAYKIEYLAEDDRLIKSTTHKGSKESAVSAARYGLYDNQADRARILDEAGQEVELLRVDG